MNCLVTTLKESVNDEMLPRIGYVELCEFDHNNRFYQPDEIILLNDSKKYKLIGDANFVYNGSAVGQEIYWNDRGSSLFGIEVRGKAKLLCPYHDARDYIKLGNYSKRVAYIDISNYSLAFYDIKYFMELFSVNMTGAIDNVLLGKLRGVQLFADNSTVYGCLDDIVFDCDEYSNGDAWRFVGHPNLTGNIEIMLNNMAKRVTVDCYLYVTIRDCPKVLYQGVSSGEFNHRIKFLANSNSWSIVE